MATHNHLSRKIRLRKLMTHTKWAPVWAVAKKFGQSRVRHMHPARITRVRRQWKRTKTKA